MFKPESKIYIPGHTGLLGTALLKELQQQGYKNLVTCSRKELDLTDKAALAIFWEKQKPEYVILAAGLTGGIVANKTYPAEFLHQNLSIQDNFFELAIRYNTKALVFFASSCVYPKQSPQPMKEEYLFTGPIEETSEAYAVAKTSGLIACKSYNKQYEKTKFICLLPNSMYGPNDNFDLENSHVLSALIRKIHDAKINQTPITLWGSGSPEREFVYSEDVANACLFTLQNIDKIENQHYNIGSGTAVSIRELAETICEVVGYEGEIIWDTSKPDGTPKKLLDSSQFLDLGWKNKMNLKQGIGATYQWFLQNIEV
ncbi:MAG: GDP-L-fucose synthase [Spirochaetota bacterium]